MLVTTIFKITHNVFHILKDKRFDFSPLSIVNAFTLDEPKTLMFVMIELLTCKVTPFPNDKF